MWMGSEGPLVYTGDPSRWYGHNRREQSGLSKSTSGHGASSLVHGHDVSQYEMDGRSGLGNTSDGLSVRSSTLLNLPVFLIPHLFPYMSTPRTSRSRSPFPSAEIKITTTPTRNAINNNRKKQSVWWGRYFGPPYTCFLEDFLRPEVPLEDFPFPFSFSFPLDFPMVKRRGVSPC